jgi:sigma-B regulation protein RsbU (phosphoserine phosphatase)
MDCPNDKQFKILLVDDTPFNIQLVGKILEDAKYLVDYATDGLQALQLLGTTYDYDLVLLDVDMPEMNGFEVCKVIRKNSRLNELPVIFLTVFSDIEKIITGFEIGAQDYITRPFYANELLARVHTHLQLKCKTDQIKEMNKMLELKSKNTTDSILYAAYIQQALLPSGKILSAIASEYFILYKPRNIVSGDFYWFKQIKNLIYVAAVDCTGHGIPGAFMSVLGISVLNEIVTKRNVNPPDFVLKELRKRVKKSLHQNGQNDDNNDGMDIAFCLINMENNTLQYAGANIPLYLIRNNESDGSLELIIKTPDHMPIGIHPNDNGDFTNHIIELQNHDKLYMFSDGYISQFGGERDKKFKTKRFREILMNIHTKSMSEQKEILDKTIEDWRGNNEQVDDILVMGLHIR